MLRYIDTIVIYNALIKQRDRQEESIDEAIGMGYPMAHIRSIKKDLRDTNEAIKNLKLLQLDMRESAE